MAKKQKYYVVWKGLKPGIYDNWNDCSMQIKGFPDAKYKGFDSFEAAEQAFRENAWQHIQRKTQKSLDESSKNTISGNISADSISVDAACSGNPGLMEYRGVQTLSGKQLFHQGPFKDGTNNIGEFLAIVHALALFEKIKNQHTIIYTDSQTAISWVKNKKARTKHTANAANQELFNLIERAENWLKAHNHRNPILKWDTKAWGEIPADFGRKK